MDIKVGRQAISEATKKLSNWGRWGKDDEIGALNLITPRSASRRRGWSAKNLTAAAHDFALVYLGVHVIDNCDMEAVAEAAGTGSPLNPIATF